LKIVFGPAADCLDYVRFCVKKQNKIGKTLFSVVM